ncbi:hypothetical protein Btru_075706 [Bulinus truncatus]|nr:hypothetical protein Btru_075706 [Bulinus truncatus]
MDELDDTASPLPLYINFKDSAGFIKKLELSGNENDWIKALEKLESKMGFDGTEILHALKIMVMSCRSLTALKNLMCTFVRKVTVLMDELKLLTDTQKSHETWKVVQTFWSLCANQHVELSGKVSGYTGEFYEILPSLASVYIDLFNAANRCKKKVKILSKKLYGWLKFELNERCMKTALLEVSERTPQGAKILAPILKKLLSQPVFQNSDDSNLDYLLHFILLKSWLSVCDDLKPVAEASLRISAPKSFVEWLKDNWSQSAEHLPDDKSFKRRRVELLLEFDEKTTEELIDVFSNCLWALCGSKGSPAAPQETSNLFVIDTKGDENQKVAPESKKTRKRKMSRKNSSQILDDDTGLETDYFLLTDPSSSVGPKAKRRKIKSDEGNKAVNGADKQEEEPMEQSVCFYLDRKSATRLQGIGVREAVRPADIIDVEQKNEAQSSCGITISSESEVEILLQDTVVGESVNGKPAEKSHIIDVEQTNEAESSCGVIISSESEVEILLQDTVVGESVNGKPAEKVHIIDVEQTNEAESSCGVTISSESEMEIIDDLKVSANIKKSPKVGVKKMKTLSLIKKAFEKGDIIEIITDDILETSNTKFRPIVTSPLKGRLNHCEVIDAHNRHTDLVDIDEYQSDQNEITSLDEQNVADLLTLSKDQEVITIHGSSPVQLSEEEKDETISMSHDGASTIERQIDLMLTQIRTSVKTVEEQPLTCIKTYLGRKFETSIPSEENNQKMLSEWLLKPNPNIKQHKTAHETVENSGAIIKLTKDSIRQSPRNVSNRSLKRSPAAMPSKTTTVKEHLGRVTQQKSPNASKLGDAEQESFTSPSQESFTSPSQESFTSPSQDTPKKKATPVSKGGKKSDKKCEAVDENCNSHVDDIVISNTTPKKTERTPDKKSNSIVSKSGKKGKANSESSSPGQESPLKRSYFLRRKNVDGTPAKCACLHDNSCSLHSNDKGFNSPRSGKMFRTRKSDISSRQSTPTGKRKSATPKV